MLRKNEFYKITGFLHNVLVSTLHLLIHRIMFHNLSHWTPLVSRWQDRFAFVTNPTPTCCQKICPIETCKNFSLGKMPASRFETEHKISASQSQIPLTKCLRTRPQRSSPRDQVLTPRTNGTCCRISALTDLCSADSERPRPSWSEARPQLQMAVWGLNTRF